MFKMLTKLILTVVSVLILILLLSITVSSDSESCEYYFHRNSENKISLTFDDGPHPINTPKILNLLDKYNVKATFFIIGQNAVNYKDTLIKIVERGHEIGNHTFSHEVIRNKSAPQIVDEVEKCRRVIYDVCGENTVVFRPPGGLMAQLDSSDAEILEGYDIIQWSIDTMDWAHNAPEEICKYVLNEIQSGDIILMHDYIGYDSPTPEALELLIPALLDKGYEFVTVSELLAS